jgi:hypothetical protein
MNDKIKVSKIVLKVGDKTVELTLEQAKEMQQILSDLFKDTPLTSPAPIYIDRPVYIPYRDNTTPAYPFWQPQFWCGNIESRSDGSVLTYMSNDK